MQEDGNQNNQPAQLDWQEETERLSLPGDCNRNRYNHQACCNTYKPLTGHTTQTRTLFACLLHAFGLPTPYPRGHLSGEQQLSPCGAEGAALRSGTEEGAPAAQPPRQLFTAAHRFPKGAVLHRRQLVNSMLCPSREAREGTKTRIQA